MRDRSKQRVEGEGKQKKVELTPALIEGFSETYLVETFDGAYDIPEFHRKLWAYECVRHRYVVVEAPRGHAKSTAGTYTFALAATLFGCDDHVLVISATEDLAAGHLLNIRQQLAENEGLIEDFEVEILKDNTTELIFMTHGRMCRIIARGAEQKLRGMNWRQKRPSLILCDDMEDDEMVMNEERRDKVKKWFRNALLPIGSDGARFRVFGTVLHLDSLLETLYHSKSWYGARFKAHRDFDDFEDILWPEKFNQERLEEIRQVYIDMEDMSGYSQEYLCEPIAEEDAYFRKNYFLPMKEEDYHKPLYTYIAVDFAISKNKSSDRTAMVVAGVDSEGMMMIIDAWVERGNGLEIIDQLFIFQKRYHPQFWIMEAGQIEKALGPFINQQMIERNIILNILTVRPTQAKVVRAKSIQKRMQVGGVKFDVEGEWFKELKQECLNFPRAEHDDRVDALAYLGLYMDRLTSSPTEGELEGEKWREEMYTEDVLEAGRSVVTGY